MTFFQLYLLRVAMGSALIVLGWNDFRNARHPGLEERLIPTLPAHAYTPLRRMAAMMLILAGLVICVTGLLIRG